MVSTGRGWIPDELLRLHDDVVDRAHAWAASKGRRLDEDVVGPLDGVLDELGVGDAFAAMEERERERFERLIVSLREVVAEIAGELQSGPPRDVGERLRALAVDLRLDE